MRIIRLIFHGMALAVILLVSTLLGYAIFKLLDVPAQLMVQGLSGAALTILFYVLLCYVLPKSFLSALELKTRKEYLVSYLISFVWTPVIFIPGYYLIIGTMTNLGNIVSVWWFQFPVCLIAVMLSAAIFKGEGVRRR